jgi:transcriptional regulator with XRE-family HTH domain
MLTTLAERLKLAMAGPPKVTNAALAKACGVKPPSVTDWCNGRTKTIEGAHLLKAADCLGVRAKWLAEGVGLMRDTWSPAPAPGLLAGEQAASKAGAQHQIIALLGYLTEDQTDEALRFLQWIIERDKKTGLSNGDSDPLPRCA